MTPSGPIDPQTVAVLAVMGGIVFALVVRPRERIRRIRARREAEYRRLMDGPRDAYVDDPAPLSPAERRRQMLRRAALILLALGVIVLLLQMPQG
ncbi:MAG: hypothetical protein PGN09_07035 [Sphingomonas fennica]